MVGEAVSKQVITLQHIQWTRFTLFSSATVLFYDYLISFDIEVELIWEKRWTLMKVIFLWLRYFGLSFVVVEILAFMMDHHLTNNLCVKPALFLDQANLRLDINLQLPKGSFWFRWETIGFSFILLTTEGVLLLWIYVVYDKNFKVLAGMGFLFIAEMTAIIVILSESFSSLAGSAHFTSGIGFCFPRNPSGFLNSFWIPVLVYHSALLSLFLVMGYRVYCPATSRHKETSLLLEAMFKSSLFNFLAIFAAYLACAIIWLGSDSGMAQVPVGFALSFCVTNCTRLLLNIRRAHHRFAEATMRSMTEAEICHTPGFEFRSYGSDTMMDGMDEEVKVRTPLMQATFSQRQLDF